MKFNSPEFLYLYLPIVLAVYWRLAPRSFAHAQIWLASVSLAFYAWWDWRYVPLLLASIAANYGLGEALCRQGRRWILAIGVGGNLVILGFFKYAGFFASTLNQLSGSALTVLHLALPLGISFFTFQKIAYLIDCYKGLVRDRDLRRFALFVLFFPQLIAGPIVHHSRFIPQLEQPTLQPLPADMARGLFLLLVGLAKKLLVADTIARYIDPLWASPDTLWGLWESWTATLGYSLQLYFDFSAYSEMAVGLALLFGLVLPINFNSPYQAVSIQDFWRRWHITLSRFLRDYVYIPLGGNRRGFAPAAIAAFSTMLLGGLWHGAGWTFVLWGALHGTYLIAYRLWQLQPVRLPRAMATGLTLMGVMFAWVLFRANSIEQTIAVWQGLVGIKGLFLPMAFAGSRLQSITGLPVIQSGALTGLEIFALLALLAFVLTQPNAIERSLALSPTLRLRLALAGVTAACAFSLSLVSSFLYWAF